MQVTITHSNRETTFQLDNNRLITTSTANYATSRAYDALFSQMIPGVLVEATWCDKPNSVKLLIEEKGKIGRSATVIGLDLSSVEGIKDYISRAYSLIKENISYSQITFDLY
jgi:hypothetical protein